MPLFSCSQSLLMPMFSCSQGLLMLMFSCSQGLLMPMFSCSQGLPMPMFSCSQGLLMSMFSCSLIKNAYWKLKLEQEWKKTNYGLEIRNAEWKRIEETMKNSIEHWWDIISVTLQIIGYLFLENEVLALPVFEHTESLERAHNVVCVDRCFLTQIYRAKTKRSIKSRDEKNWKTFIIEKYIAIQGKHCKIDPKTSKGKDQQVAKFYTENCSVGPTNFIDVQVLVLLGYKDSQPFNRDCINPLTNTEHWSWTVKRRQDHRPYLASHPVLGNTLLVT